MRFEGDPEVLKNLFRKQALLASGDTDHYRYRPMLIAGSGVMRGAYGVGQGVALSRFGLNHVFDVALGISTGAPIIAYFLALMRRESIYWTEARMFVSLRRFLLGKGPVADTDWLCDQVFCDLDWKTINSARTRFYTGATCADSGVPLFLDANMHGIEAIRGSVSMPGLSRGPVAVSGRLCLDGGGAMKFPVEQAYHRFAPTDILVLANCPDPEHQSGPNRWAPLTVLKYSQEVQRTFARARARAGQELQFARTTKDCRVAILWTDDAVSRFTMDEQKLQAACLRAEKHLYDLLLLAQDEIESEQCSLAAE